MPFKKAEPKQARLKMSLYGKPGSGKTFTTLLWAEGLAKKRGGRIAYVDTERGTDFYAMTVPQRQLHPEPFDFDAIYTKSLAEVTKELKALDPKVYSVIVIDSWSHIWDAAQEAYTGKRQGDGGIPAGGWPKLKKPYKHILDWVIHAPFDLFILGREKALYEDFDNNPRRVGSAMRAEGDTQYEPTICIHMEARLEGPGSTKSIHEAYVEKDRTGVLSGKVIRNPTFAHIEPLLPLLCGEMAPMEDEDERIANDAELANAADDKTEKKAERSRELLAAFQGQILACQSMIDLGNVQADLKKSKRYLLEEHVAALVEVYKATRDRIVGKLAPEVA